MIDFEVARENMIESQVRPNGITDGRVIAAMADIPREQFVPEHQKSVAYMDGDVRLHSDGVERMMMEPMAFARLVQLARIGAGDFVLDVGCASGYSAAVIAQICSGAVAIDEDAAMCEAAIANLDALEISNVAVLQVAHAEGCADQAPFDVIVIEGRVPAVPEQLLSQLKEAGRLVAIVGDDTVARAQLWTRHGDSFANRDEFNATVAPLPGIEVERPAFTF